MFPVSGAEQFSAGGARWRLRPVSSASGAYCRFVSDVALAEGYLDAGEIVEVYARERGVEVSDLGFHLGLAFFKLAAILEGIHARYLSGQTVGAGFETTGALVEPAIAAGLASIKERTP
jgi:aminoglycoside phosphotransferase (APT) family kinase protein